MSHIDIHPRIEQRHPEIKPQDVYDAVRGMVSYTRRESGEWVGVGFDAQGRFIELVYVYDEDLDSFLVYHAMIPPSAKTLRELRMER